MSNEILQNFIFDRGQVDLLVISGPETVDFLNRISTLNFKKPMTTSLHGAFLNGQAKLISLFTTWQQDGKTYLFVEKNMFLKTKEFLEQMHFAENLKIETEKYFCAEFRGKSESFNVKMIVEAFNWGIPGKYFFDEVKFEVKSILEKNYDAIRASFSFPKPMQDLTDDHVLIEGPLEDWVDRNKGCYPGQEVIEKIYTYGRVARKIKKLTFENATEADVNSLSKSLPLDIESEGNKVGTLTSVYNGKSPFGLATLKRLFYEKQTNVQISHNDKILNAHIE